MQVLCAYLLCAPQERDYDILAVRTMNRVLYLFIMILIINALHTIGITCG